MADMTAGCQGSSKHNRELGRVPVVQKSLNKGQMAAGVLLF